MKIVFVCAEDESPGICLLSAFLKKHGHQVNLVFEPKQFDRAYIRAKFLAKIFSRDEKNIAEIRGFHPDIIGFSCTTAHYQWAINFARKVKENFPEIPIIFGGIHPTLVPEIVIDENCVDFVCIGEGEEALLELLQSLEKGGKEFNIQNIWYKSNGKVTKNPLRNLTEDLDSLPYADRDLFLDYLPESYRKYIYFFTGRGCPFTCSFCSNEQLKKIFKGLGKYVRRMGVERAIEELKYIKEKYRPKRILFEDDIFTVDYQWLKRFIPEYKKEINLSFICFCHPKFLTEETALLLKEGGCKLLSWGIQSASEEIRKKVFHRFETNEDIIKAADICHKAGIRFMIDHILNIPYDREDAIKEAIILYNRIRPGMINCYNLLYFPKSRIIDIASEAGVLNSKDIDMITQGKAMTYETGDFLSKENDFYQKYALLLSVIPLLPKKWVEKIYKNNKLTEFFSKLPLFFIPIIKVILNFRIGCGFLPLSIIRIEIFFTSRFLTGKFRKDLSKTWKKTNPNKT